MTKTVREMIWRGRICIGDDKSGACCSQLNMIQDVSSFICISVVKGRGKVGCSVRVPNFLFIFICRIYYYVENLGLAFIHPKKENVES